MKKIDYSNLYKIAFWKRSQTSIEQINQYSFLKENSLWSFKYNNNDNEINQNEMNNLISKLKEMDLENTSDEYKAYYYEDNKKDYALKFLLFVEDNNHIYFGIKGLYPFKQNNYQEVVNLFEQIKKSS